MKTARFFTTLSLLAALAMFQWPTSAPCQMGLAGSYARVCSMPCCKKVPMPSCPHLKAQQPPQDTIADSPVSVSPLFYVVGAVDMASNWRPAVTSAYFKPIVDALTAWLVPRAVLGRAPPAFSSLLAA